MVVPAVYDVKQPNTHVYATELINDEQMPRQELKLTDPMQKDGMRKKKKEDGEEKPSIVEVKTLKSKYPVEQRSPQ